MSSLASFPITKPFSGRSELLFSEFGPEAQRQEVDRVNAELETERAWLQGEDFLLLASKAGILAAVQSGELVAVTYDEPNFMPLYDFKDRQTPEALAALSDEPKASEFSVPFLRPAALSMLRLICQEAHDLTKHSTTMPAGVTDFRYAVTSMTRSPNNQRTLVARRALAADPQVAESTHSYGLAFDIDHSGIYVESNGNWDGVGIGRQPERDVPAAIYNLSEVILSLQKVGLINAICEVPNGRGCYHVAVNPDAAIL